MAARRYGGSAISQARPVILLIMREGANRYLLNLRRLESFGDPKTYPSQMMTTTIIIIMWLIAENQWPPINSAMAGNN